jgi:ATP-dependent RNA helicase DDX1
MLSVLDRDALCAVDRTGTLVQTRHARDWGGVRANLGVKPGSKGSKWYFEATVTDEGLARVGWTAGRNGTRNLGTDGFSFGFGGTGKKSANNKFDDYGEKYGLNDTIGCLLTSAADGSGAAQLSFNKNGADLGVAFTVPAALASQGMYPAVCLKNAEMKFNFGSEGAGAEPLKYLPAGARAVGSARPEERTDAAAASGNSSAAAASSAGKSKPAAGASPFAIILEPTRELAQQVCDELAKFVVNLKDPVVKYDCFVGGVSANDMVKSIKSGLHIVVGTAGRVCELVKSGKLDVSDSRVLVLDEADHLIGDAGTKNDILNLYNAMPKQSKGVQVVICSATLHSLDVQLLANQVTVNATWVDLKGKDAVPDTVDHVVVLADPRNDRRWQTAKLPQGLRTDGVHASLAARPSDLKIDAGDAEALSEALKILKPMLLLDIIDQFKMEQCMIFARTQLDCDLIEQFLTAAGGGQGFATGRGGAFQRKETGPENRYSCVVLHGGREARAREANLAAFKEGLVRFLVCTDVAARGIDVRALPYVINLSLPTDEKGATTYVHRVGRVGRADQVGLAISIVAAEGVQEKVWYHTCAGKGRGASACNNTRLVEQGGCTVWVDEADLLEDVEKLLGQEVPHLDRARLQLGAEFVTNLASKSRRKVPDDGAAASVAQVKALKPTVDQLADLEVQAQNVFWNTKRSTKWRDMLSA